MTIGTVLALVTDGSESESSLKTAIAVGQKLDAYVEVLHVRAVPESVIPVVAGATTASTVDRLLEGVRASTEERAGRAHRLFQDVALEMSLPLTKADAEPAVGRFSIAWHETQGIESFQVVRHGRLFDLTVLPRADVEQENGSSTALTAALFELGRPILIAPTVPPATVGRHVMLAWNDSREAAACIWAALPFAARAQEVTVVSVTEASSALDPGGLVRALARHGIAAQARSLFRGEASVGESLLAAAEKSNCDLLVMGAYGHSRLQEHILGGATKHILQHARIPLLMAH